MYRGFVVNAGAVVLDSLVLQGMVARGGDGGAGAQAGGGAAGLGGAVFVASGATVDLSNISFAGNRAIGGAGGTTTGAGAASGGVSNLPGGFGDGGAGGTAGGFGGGGGTSASGGFGGGNNAGGGLAAGGNIFVEAGGTLTVSSGAVSAGGLSAGAAGTGGTSGGAYGSGIFIQGNNSITLGNVTVSGVIADQTGSDAGGASAGAGTVVINGTTTLSAANTYTGGTLIEAGSLTLQASSAAGSGAIDLASPAVKLIIGANDVPANVITGFALGETIDLQGIGLATDPMLGIGNHLIIQGSTGPITLNLDPTVSYANDAFILQSDGGTGTNLTMTVSHFSVGSESDLNTVLSEIDAGGKYAAPNVASTRLISPRGSHSAVIFRQSISQVAIVTIDGAGQTLDGGNAYRGFFVYSGPVTIENLTIKDTAAIGGVGGAEAQPGGGGAGLGGGLFVASSGSVTLPMSSSFDEVHRPAVPPVLSVGAEAAVAVGWAERAEPDTEATPAAVAVSAPRRPVVLA